MGPHLLKTRQAHQKVRRVGFCINSPLIHLWVSSSPVPILVRCPSVFQHCFIAKRILIINLNGICALHPQSSLHIDLLLSMQFINAVVQRTKGAATSDPGTTVDHDVRSIQRKGRCSSRRVEFGVLYLPFISSGSPPSTPTLALQADQIPEGGGTVNSKSPRSLSTRARHHHQGRVWLT